MITLYNLFSVQVDGPTIKVTGSDYQHCTGIYVLSVKKASRSPDRPVYKKIGFDRFIYFYPSSNGWRIGRRAALSAGENEGEFWFESKSFSKCLVKYGHVIICIQLLLFKATMTKQSIHGKQKLIGFPIMILRKH